MKSICTECFLQMKTPNSTRPTQCPFCKTSNYAVEYRGVKTKEEKGMEQIEEQRVIEAKIRMRQQELLDEEERKQKIKEISSSIGTMAPGEVEFDILPVPCFASSVEGEEIVSLQEPCPSTRQSIRPRQNRDDEFDLDLEETMVMEAIWLSIQENGRFGNPIYRYSVPSEQYMTEDHCVSASLPPLAEPSLSPSGGFAGAIAALAEHQQTGRESSTDYEANVSTFNMQVVESSFAVSHDSQLTMSRNDGEWDDEIGHECQVAEVGTESWEF
ncbi:hypothetical protein U1Q18_000415 [Sarracenia purpurea var. burkii]